MYDDIYQLDSYLGDIELLKQAVKQFTESFLKQIDNSDININEVCFYDKILEIINEPVLEALIKHYRHNQTTVSSILGLSRGTVRKKLKKHNLIK